MFIEFDDKAINTSKIICIEKYNISIPTKSYGIRIIMDDFDEYNKEYVDEIVRDYNYNRIYNAFKN